MAAHAHPVARAQKGIRRSPGQARTGSSGFASSRSAASERISRDRSSPRQACSARASTARTSRPTDPRRRALRCGRSSASAPMTGRSGRAIRSSGPSVVVVFHQALIGSSNVTAGLAHGGTIVVNSEADPAEMRERLGVGGVTVGVVDGLGIAVEESTRVNTCMLGAAARVCGFIETDLIRHTLAERLGRRYPDLVEANLQIVRPRLRRAAARDVRRSGRAASRAASGRLRHTATWRRRSAGRSPRPGAASCAT